MGSNKKTLTELGLYLQKKSANKAEVARRTGIHKTRITELCNSETARLTAKELYLIVLAVNDKPDEVFLKLFSGVELLSEDEQEARRLEEIKNRRKAAEEKAKRLAE